MIFYSPEKNKLEIVWLHWEVSQWLVAGYEYIGELL